jgi:hypothetical protein
VRDLTSCVFIAAESKGLRLPHQVFRASQGDRTAVKLQTASSIPSPRPALAADRHACKRGALGRLGCWGRLRSRAPLTIPCPLRACVNASVEPGQLTEYS